MGILSQKIDSLDLLKQNLKRKGETIAEIEQRQDSLRDSLRMVRDNLQTASNIPSKTSGKRNLPLFIQKPTNPFDWIIVITGAVALFSGLMLFIGIARSLRLKQNRQKRKQGAPSRDHEKQGMEKRVKTVAAYPAYEAPPPSSAPSPVIDSGSINQLRQRLDNQQSFQHNATPAVAAAQPVQPQCSPNDASETDAIEHQILDASRNGLDITAISRKFHLSADHVALILKMAAPQSPPR
ncbi:MAG: hypothetical protein JXA18_16520 [Chitinispirillaceae bacterium]|nr:hypothetical protein [Chitinispirillaceae bacterium]